MRRGPRNKWLVGLLLGLFAVLGLLGAAPSPAEAQNWAKNWEWYAAGFVGGAFPNNDDFKITNDSLYVGIPPPTTTEIKVRDGTFLASPLAGVKGGVCPSLFPNFCVELEFDHFNPTLDTQVAKGETSFPPFFGNVSFAPAGKLDLSVWDLGLNLIGRLPLLKESGGYPLGGRLHLYAGAGPDFVWTKARDQCISFVSPGGSGIVCGKTDTDFSLGVQALGGLKFFITKNLALFGEYKFNHWRSELKFSGSGQSTVFVAATFNETSKITHLDFNVNLFSVGLALHF